MACLRRRDATITIYNCRSRTWRRWRWPYGGRRRMAWLSDAVEDGLSRSGGPTAGGIPARAAPVPGQAPGCAVRTRRRGAVQAGPGARAGRAGRLRSDRVMYFPAPVRAENLVRGCDQQSCLPRRPAVMITGHVPAVRLPPDHRDGLRSAAVPASGDTEDRRDLDPAPPAHRPAAAAAAPPGPGLGGPGLDRDPPRR